MMDSKVSCGNETDRQNMFTSNKKIPRIGAAQKPFSTCDNDGRMEPLRPGQTYLISVSRSYQRFAAPKIANDVKKNVQRFPENIFPKTFGHASRLQEQRLRIVLLMTQHFSVHAETPRLRTHNAHVYRDARAVVSRDRFLFFLVHLTLALRQGHPVVTRNVVHDLRLRQDRFQLLECLVMLGLPLCERHPSTTNLELHLTARSLSLQNRGGVVHSPPFFLYYITYGVIRRLPDKERTKT